ncbi:MAG: T9SS type A sorting domain-containing protein [Bacteroidota bacterium]
MRQFLLTLMLLCLAVIGYTQYYTIPFVGAGTNPGGINNESEISVQAGLTGWTEINGGGSATPEWSSTETIPFAFEFNGATVTEFKVSNSGVLTFSTSVADAPQFENTTLPSNKIPDNSVCVWGLRGSYATDKILTKVFGTAGNQQMWIQFNSYEYYGSTFPVCELIWSIVLEEGTNQIYIVDQRAGALALCQPALTLGVQISQSSAVQVAGSPNIGSQTTDATGTSDNSYYAFIPGLPPQNDLLALTLNIPDVIYLSDAPVPVEIGYVSNGAAALKSFDFTYDVDGVSAGNTHYSYTFNNSAVVHNRPWVPTVEGNYVITATLSSPNGLTDDNPANNTITKTVKVLNSPIDRIALVEAFTAHNCGPCATLNPILDDLHDMGNELDLAIVRITTQFLGTTDPRRLFNPTDNSTRETYYNINSIPTSYIGNAWTGNTGSVDQTLIDAEVAKTGLVDIQISESVNANNISASVNFNLLESLNATDLRAHVAIMQDELHYSTPTGSNGEKDYYHTMRYMLPDGNGTQFGANTSLTVSGQKTKNAVFNGSMMRVVAWVQDHATQEVFMTAKSTGMYFCTNNTVLQPTVSVGDASCGLSNGTVDLTVDGGAAPYNYSWSSGETTGNIANKAPGDYHVTISDNAGCTFTVPVRVKEAPEPQLFVATEAISCNGELDGKATATIDGGVEPYTYSWSDGQTTSEAVNLAPGSYTVTVTDDANCVVDQTIEIDDKDPLAGTGRQLRGNSGSQDGEAELTAISGGTHPYTVRWNTSPPQTGLSANNLFGGPAVATITDYAGCKTNVSVTISGPVSIEEIPGISDMNVFPNPSNGKVNLALQMEQLGDLQIEIIDMKGQIVMKRQLAKVSHVEESFDLTAQPKGVYLIKLTTEVGTGTKSVVIK